MLLFKLIPQGYEIPFWWCVGWLFIALIIDFISKRKDKNVTK